MIIFNQLGKKGRLGNQLFQIAATLAHAKRMNTHAVFNEWEYAKYFEKRLNDFPQSEYVKRLEEAQETFADIIEDQKRRFTPFPLDDELILHGYFQSQKFFADQVDYILSYFYPKQELYQVVRNRSGEILNLQNITAVHVRRKDYLNLGFVFNPLHKEYYDMAMKTVEEKASKTNYLFFSDDIDWCKKVFGMKHNYSTDNSNIVDLFTMALCKHHIIANSSFSWWGAYLKRIFLNEEELKNSVTVAPATWFAPESKFIDKDICCNDWIKI